MSLAGPWLSSAQSPFPIESFVRSIGLVVGCVDSLLSQVYMSRQCSYPFCLELLLFDLRTISYIFTVILINCMYFPFPFFFKERIYDLYTRYNSTLFPN